MGNGPMLLGAVVFVLLVFVAIGGPMVLTDWLRKRREETIRRQIALTDAIDGKVGPIVSPLVKNPLWGPWQIQIAVPPSRSAAVGKIFAVAHEVLTIGDRMNTVRYQIVLTPKQDPIRDGRETRTNQPVGWRRHTRVAA